MDEPAAALKRGPAARRILVAAALAATAVALALWRRRPAAPRLVAAPAADYGAALARWRLVQEAEQGRVTAYGRSRLLGQGQKTGRAYVLIHGLTNSPAQWLELGQRLHARGHNVLLLRMPRHGLTSHDARALQGLRPQELRAYGQTAVDIAAGLGEEVVVAGSSGGAAVAAWLAQNRPEVAQALLLAPFFGIHKLPPGLAPPLAGLLRHLPNFVLHNGAEPQRAWVYHGQASHGVAAFLALGQEVLRQARAGQAPGGRVAVLTTAVEDTANNGATAVLVELWRQAGAGVQQVEFPAAAAIPHNAIDPAADPQKRARVYAALLRLLGEPQL